MTNILTIVAFALVLTTSLAAASPDAKGVTSACNGPTVSFPSQCTQLEASVGVKAEVCGIYSPEELAQIKDAKDN